MKLKLLKQKPSLLFYGTGGKKKSFYWVYMLCREHLNTKYSDQFEYNFIKNLDNIRNDSHIIIADDMAYSGSQINGILDNINFVTKVNKPQSINIVLGYCTETGENIIKRQFTTKQHRLYMKQMDSISDKIPELKDPTYVNLLNEILGIKEPYHESFNKPMSVFNHKVADGVSLPRGLISEKLYEKPRPDKFRPPYKTINNINQSDINYNNQDSYPLVPSAPPASSTPPAPSAPPAEWVQQQPPELPYYQALGDGPALGSSAIGGNKYSKTKKKTKYSSKTQNKRNKKNQRRSKKKSHNKRQKRTKIKK